MVNVKFPNMIGIVFKYEKWDQVIVDCFRFGKKQQPNPSKKVLLLCRKPMSTISSATQRDIDRREFWHCDQPWMDRRTVAFQNYEKWDLLIFCRFKFGRTPTKPIEILLLCRKPKLSSVDLFFPDALFEGRLHSEMLGYMWAERNCIQVQCSALYPLLT